MTIKTLANVPANTTVYMALYGQQGSNYVYYDWKNSQWDTVTANEALPVHSYTTTGTGNEEAVCTVEVPLLQGARLYVSYGKELTLKGNAGGGVSTPSPWKEDDPLHKFMVDKVEFTTSNNNGLYELNINTTCVDFFGIPLQYNITGYAGATTKSPVVSYSAGVTSTREQVYNDINSDPIFRKLLQRPDGGGASDYYRILAPGTSIVKDVDNFPSNFFDSYIDYCWNTVFKPNGPEIKLVNINPLHVPVGVPTKQYTGSMQSIAGKNQLVFTAAKGNPTDGFTPVATVTVECPTTQEVMTGTISATAVPTGSGTQADATDAQGFVTAQLSAAICRTCLHVMSDQGNYTDSTVQATYDNYYKQRVVAFENDPANGYANDLYSQVLHNHSIGNKCYSSPYSDQYGWSAFKAVFNPTAWDVLVGH